MYSTNRDYIFSTFWPSKFAISSSYHSLIVGLLLDASLSIILIFYVLVFLQFASGLMSSFDRVAAQAHSAFNSIAGSVPLLSGKKVMAALIIHTEDGTMDDEVIALGTGGFKKQ